MHNTNSDVIREYYIRQCWEFCIPRIVSEKFVLILGAIPLSAIHSYNPASSYEMEDIFKVSKTSNKEELKNCSAALDSEKQK